MIVRVSRSRPEEKLFFLHVPKTGGMSLHTMLARHFEPQEICPERHFEAVLIPPQEAARYRFFSAHTTYDLFTRLPKPARIVTLMRDPITRTISDYYFLKRFQADAIDPRLARAIPIADYLDWNNRYFQQRIVDKHATFYCGHQFLNPFGVPWRSKEEIFDVCCARIETMDFVGITEHMAESVIGMWEVLGFPEPPPPIAINDRSDAQRAADAAEITPSVLARIEELNQVDLRLYAFAKERFHRMKKGERHLKPPT